MTAPATAPPPVVVPEDRIRVFVSSSMDELRTERAAMNRWLRANGFDSFLYDRHAGPRETTPEETYLEELVRSDVYLGLFWKNHGVHTIEEYEAADRLGMPCLLYVKERDARRDVELAAWLHSVGEVRAGRSLGYFESIGDGDLEAELVRAVHGAAKRALRRIRAGARELATTEVGAAGYRAPPTRRPPAWLTRPTPSIEPLPPDEPALDRVPLRDWFTGQLAQVPPPRVVAWYGPAHIGKTTMVKELAHRGFDATFPDGVVTGSAAGKEPHDMVEAIAARFFDMSGLLGTDGKVVFNPELASALAGLRALIFVEDVAWQSPDDARPLTSTFRSSTFVLTARDRGPLPRDAREFPMLPLPADDAMALFARRLGRPPADAAEEEAVAKICGAAGLKPGRIVDLARCAETRDLAAMASDDNLLADPCLTEFHFTSDEQDQLLAALIAFADVASPRDVLNRLFSDAAALAKGTGGVVVAQSPRYSLSGELATRLPEVRDPDEWVKPMLAATGDWAAEAAPRAILDEHAFVVRVLERGAEMGLWQGVLHLARSVEGAFALHGRWGTWERVLQWARQAAVEVGDRSAEAWALHQLGTRRLGLGQDRAACGYLEAARTIREDLGEHVAAAVTRQNLRVVGDTAAATSLATFVMWVAGVVALVALAVLGIPPWRALGNIEFGADVPVGDSRTQVSELFVNDSGSPVTIDVALAEDAGPAGHAFCLVAGDRCLTATGTPLGDGAGGGAFAGPPPALGPPGMPLAQAGVSVPCELDAGAAPGTFALTIPAHSEGCFAASFAPPAAGDYEATVTVTVEGGEWDITLRGSGIDPRVRIEKSHRLEVDADGSGAPSAGDTVAFEILVTNVGVGPLEAVRVADSMTRLACEPAPGADLAAGGVMRCEARYIVTGADEVRRGLVNTATVTAGVPGARTRLTAGVDEEVEVVPVGRMVLAVAVDGDPQAVSLAEELTYRFVVTNRGATALREVVVAADGVALDCRAGRLGAGESLACPATHTVTEDDLARGSVDVTATARAGDAGGVDRTAEAAATTPVAAVTLDSRLARNADEDGTGTVSAGDTLSFELRAANPGAVALGGVVVTGPAGRAACDAAALGPGEALECAATYVVTAADATAGVVDTTARAAGLDPDGDDVTAEAVTSVLVGPAGIFLDKSHDPGPPPAVGEPITFRLVITNTGDRPLTAVRLDDPSAGGVACDPAVPPEGTRLAPGASVECRAEHVVDEEDVARGSVRNVATATGVDPDGFTHSATASEEVPLTEAPLTGISLAKALLTAEDVDGSGTTDRLTYGFTVTNVGPVELTGVTVADPLPGLSALACDPAPGATLAPGGTMGCTAGYDVTPADRTAGVVVNTATAEGRDPDGTARRATATVRVPIPPVPPRPAVVDILDEVLEFGAAGESRLVEILNAGTAPVTPAADPPDGFTVAGCTQALAPGASCTLTVTYEGGSPGVAVLRVDSGADGDTRVLLLAP